MTHDATTIPTYAALELAASALIDVVEDHANASIQGHTDAGTMRRVGWAIGDVCDALGARTTGAKARHHLAGDLDNMEADAGAGGSREDWIDPEDAADLAVDLEALVDAWRKPYVGGWIVDDLDNALEAMSDAISEMTTREAYGKRDADAVYDLGPPDADRVAEAVKSLAAARELVTTLARERDDLREEIETAAEAGASPIAVTTAREAGAAFGDALERVAIGGEIGLREYPDLARALGVALEAAGAGEAAVKAAVAAAAATLARMAGDVSGRVCDVESSLEALAKDGGGDD